MIKEINSFSTLVVRWKQHLKVRNNKVVFQQPACISSSKLQLTMIY